MGESRDSENISYMSVKEASAEWGISEDEVREYCKQNKDSIGAIKTGKLGKGRWQIPLGTPKPIRGKELKMFARDILKFKDNPTQYFPHNDPDKMFSLLIQRGYIVLTKEKYPNDVLSYVFTSAGYDYVFSGITTNSLICPSASLVSINILPVGPSLSAINVNGSA